MLGLLTAGAIIGVASTIGVQRATRAVRKRIRKALRPKVQGQIRNGRRVK